MNYKIEGKGKLLVFIHGLSDNLLYWETLTNNLKKDYKILRIDLRGHGESELGSDEITIDTYVEDLKNLLDKLLISKVNLIGFSLGGAVALDFAIKYPNLVDSIVLMSSFYKTGRDSNEVLIHLKNALKNNFEEFYDLILPLVLCPEVILDNKVELNLIKEIALQNANVEAYVKAVDACLNFNVEKDLFKINIPTLILAGKYDGIFSLNSQKNLQSKIKNSKLIVFNNVKHNLLVGENNSVILDILKKEFK
ncbi:MAG: alpha/beta hydrolase [Methanobrevibacter thaueri]|nr:alpha/beta hydrolase [Methanobrevibacter thaueri]